MEKEEKFKIAEIMSGMKCSKNFKCARHKFERLCEAEDCGLDNYLKCVCENPELCDFSIPYGGNYYCKCPLRVYLAKKFGK